MKREREDVSAEQAEETDAIATHSPVKRQRNNPSAATPEERTNKFIEALIAIGQIPKCFNPYNSEDKKRDEIRISNLRKYLNFMQTENPDTIIVGEAPGYNGCRWSGVPLSSEFLMLESTHILYSKIGNFQATSTLSDEEQTKEEEEGEQEHGEGSQSKSSSSPKKTKKKQKQKNKKKELSPVKEKTATVLWRILTEIYTSQEEGSDTINEDVANETKQHGEEAELKKTKQRMPYPLMWNAFPLHPFKDKPNSNRAPTQQEITQLSHILKQLVIETFPTVKHFIALGRKAEHFFNHHLTAEQRESYSMVYVRHPSQGGSTECKKGLLQFYNSR